MGVCCTVFCMLEIFHNKFSSSCGFYLCLLGFLQKLRLTLTLLLQQRETERCHQFTKFMMPLACVFGNNRPIPGLKMAPLPLLLPRDWSGLCINKTVLLETMCPVFFPSGRRMRKISCISKPKPQGQEAGAADLKGEVQLGFRTFSGQRRARAKTQSPWIIAEPGQKWLWSQPDAPETSSQSSLHHG